MVVVVVAVVAVVVAVVVVVVVAAAVVIATGSLILTRRECPFKVVPVRERERHGAETIDCLTLSSVSVVESEIRTR